MSLLIFDLKSANPNIDAEKVRQLTSTKGKWFFEFASAPIIDSQIYINMPKLYDSDMYPNPNSLDSYAHFLTEIYQ